MLVNRCLYGSSKLRRSKLLSRKTKVRLYHQLIMPVLLYGTLFENFELDVCNGLDMCIEWNKMSRQENVSLQTRMDIERREDLGPDRVTSYHVMLEQLAKSNYFVLHIVVIDKVVAHAVGV
uniref:Uncharacterized protein n=1 Tax=Megaselia scalaris TaxID=36166 RepID=T1G9W3_MEGSC